MTKISEINEMFRQERYDEAFELATNEWQSDTDNVWEQRKMGWALSFMMKRDVEKSDFQSFIEHLQVLQSLNHLECEGDDHKIFDAITWRIGQFPYTLEQCSEIFSVLQSLSFVPSNGYSLMLKTFLKHKEWPMIETFLEWWNFDKLMPNDYEPFVIKAENGKEKRLMPLAEYAYITYAKCLLARNNLQKIREFEPRLEQLSEQHPQMTYPGYFCGKLLLAMDADDQRTLHHLIPFVRRKFRDFWAWQLLAEVFDEDLNKQIACLYRATSCNRDENFLGKIRLQLAKLLAAQNDFNRAKYQIDAVIQNRIRNNWSETPALSEWIHQPWFNTAHLDSSCPVDFMAITDEIVGFRTITQKSQSAKQTIEGTVTSNKLKTAMFLSNDDTYAFIPKSLAQNLKVGDRAKATIIPSFDKKKNTMGLKCINIETFFCEPNTSDASFEIPRIESHHYDYYDTDTDIYPF